VGVTIVVVVFLIGALLNVLVGVDLLGISGELPSSERGPLAAPTGAVMLISALLLIIGAYGLWTLRPWGWTLGVVAMVAGLGLNLLQYLNNSALLVTMLVASLIPVVILWYLFQPQVRATFRGV
jgi:hypothetical protein